MPFCWMHAQSAHSSHGVPLGPLASRSVMACYVSLVDVGNLWHERIIRVGVSQERADREKHLRDREGWWPLVLQDVQADWTVAVDVHVINFRCEGNLGRLEWIVGREVDVQEEHALVVGWVFWAHNGGLPMELVRLVGRSSRAVRGRVSTEVDEFLLDSFKRHNIVYNKWSGEHTTH